MKWRGAALRSAVLRQRQPDLLRDPEAWGHQVEVAVGAHLLATAPAAGLNVAWWRERDAEVAYVRHGGGRVLGLEVKSGRRRRAHGLTAFQKAHPGAAGLVVGIDMDLEAFLLQPAGH